MYVMYTPYFVDVPSVFKRWWRPGHVLQETHQGTTPGMNVASIGLHFGHVHRVQNIWPHRIFNNSVKNKPMKKIGTVYRILKKFCTSIFERVYHTWTAQIECRLGWRLGGPAKWQFWRRLAMIASVNLFVFEENAFLQFSTRRFFTVWKRFLFYLWLRTFYVVEW